MNLYIQLFIIILITYYLFFKKSESNKKVEKFGFKRTVGSGLNMIPMYVKKNYTDLNDLSLPKSKTRYPIDFDVTSLNKERVKYLKAIDNSLDQIRLLANDNKEAIYNVQERNPIPIDANPQPFLFLADYLVDKLNLMSANLYNVQFVKFNEIKGEEVDEQYKVEFKMAFNMKTKKESYEDKKNDFSFVVKADTIINKPNSLFNTTGRVFFRTLFVDEDLVNHYMPANIYKDWGK